MPKLLRKAAIAAKIETTSGTDAVPTDALNAMLVRNLSWRPLAMTMEERDFVRAYLGNSESIVVSRWVEVEFGVEVAGSGTAGDAPAYGVLLRGCGMDETLSAGVSAVYSPLSEGFETLTIYCQLDGLLHKSLFTMGTFRVVLDANKIPEYRFTFRGLFQPVTDTTAWTPDYGGFVKPLVINKANTTLTLHGAAAVVEALTLDLGHQVEYRNLINSESVRITDRKAGGSVSLEMTTVAVKNWLASIEAATTGALELVHGTTAGNIVEFDAPAVQLTEPQYQDSQGIAMLQANLKLVPGATGNDELVVTVR